MRKHTVEKRTLGQDANEGWPKDLEIEGISVSICDRTKESREHVLFVAAMTSQLARQAGLSEGEIHYVEYGALLHDFGKVGIPERILLKPGSLTAEEWDLIRRHPVYAQDLLFPISYLRPCLSIPISHHERWDGGGYPLGLKGNEIPFPARLFAVVDTWDALSSDHPYRPAWSEEKVMDYLRQQSGNQFDPQVVDLFLDEVSKGHVPFSEPVL